MVDHLELVRRAVERIEAHLEEPIDLQRVARWTGVSPYHFHRIFAGLAGETVTEYVRLRRLTEAARRLVSTRDRIVEIALASGYDSQEAFTRAFARRFGATPGRFRRAGHPLRTQWRLPLDAATLTRLAGGTVMEPTMKTLPAFHVVGMCGWFEPESGPREIPKLWDRFVPRLDSFPEIVGDRTWGVCFGDRPLDPDAPKSFFYMAAAEVPDLSDIPTDMVGKTVPGARYAVFTHRGGLARLRESISYIWGKWLPGSGHRPAGTPDLELYDERFHPETGEIDLYIPLAPDGE